MSKSLPYLPHLERFYRVLTGLDLWPELDDEQRLELFEAFILAMPVCNADSSALHEKALELMSQAELFS